MALSSTRAFVRKTSHGPFAFVAKFVFGSEAEAAEAERALAPWLEQSLPEREGDEPWTRRFVFAHRHRLEVNRAVFGSTSTPPSSSDDDESGGDSDSESSSGGDSDESEPSGAREGARSCYLNSPSFRRPSPRRRRRLRDSDVSREEP